MLRWVAPLALLAACEAIETQDGMFSPITVTSPAVVAAPPADTDAADTDAAADPDVTDTDAVADTDPVEDNPYGELVAEPVPTEPPVEAVSPTADEAPAAIAPVPAPVAPAVPAPSWGMWLVSTVPNAQPPRAILGFPDGREVVVRPGQLVPDAGVVVMAIGRDAVTVAEVVATGDTATVATKELRAMYGAQPGGPGR